MSTKQEIRGQEMGKSGASGEPVVSVRFDEQTGELVLLDQTLLPNETRFIRLSDPGEVWEAIYQLRVRGAPAIGVAAAYGAYLGIKESGSESREQFTEELRQVSDYLNSSRPTAVNLSWALRRIARRVDEEVSASVPELKQVIKAEADQIRREDEEVCRKIGEHGLSLLEPGWGLLTHCNAGTVATARYGTALAPIYLGEQQGYDFSVYADETRPLLQGIRLTAWELQQAGVDVTVICDSMASLVMKQQKVQAVVVGCDRVAANGDAANKIGTSGLAILAKHYGIPFYIHAPLSTIDMECASGDDIPIEEREPDEISKRWYAAPMAPEGTPSYNPAFDVTDAELITAIITEKGVVYPPYTENLRRLFE